MMSVKVTTPTKTSFGEAPSVVSDFGGKLDIVNITVDQQKLVTSVTGTKERYPSARSTPFSKKSRRSIEKGQYGSQGKKKGQWFDKQNQKDRIKLPTKFLLGGNITDPLNLNSFNDEEVNKAANAVTPVSSPLPTPLHRRQKVEVLIPPNINDPLNLNSAEDVEMELISPRLLAKKRKKNKRKKSGSEQTLNVNHSQNDQGTRAEDDLATALNLQLDKKVRKIVDSIVSPAIPQDSPKPRRKRTVSENKSTDCKLPESPVKSAEKQNFKKQLSNQIVQKPIFRAKDEKFTYGNYDRYYGKRNPDSEEDKRLSSFQKEWFEGKDVLDIGCNIGHITLSIAKKFSPKNITGMDIDPKLISIARKNVRHYISQDSNVTQKFPAMLPSTYGPVAAPPIPEDDKSTFPDNIYFVQGNYVLDSDELLELQCEEFDTILGLSLTKWIHLNFGDDGLKRAFKRMYKQLRPGGKLILEPQARSTYKKKKKINEKIWKNYQEIQLWPDKFRKYLLSPEIGFTKCEFLDTPYNRSKGFQRPIMMFTKAETTSTTPREVTESRGVTPLMNIDCGGHSFTPTQTYDLHPSFSFSSTHLPIRGYDAFLESPTTSRTLTPTQELIAVTGRVGTPRFDVGTPSVSARNTPIRQLTSLDSEGSWFHTQGAGEGPLFDQLSDQEDGASEEVSGVIVDVQNEAETPVLNVSIDDTDLSMTKQTTEPCATVVAATDSQGSDTLEQLEESSSAGEPPVIHGEQSPNEHSQEKQND